jgi:hypothetical protein
VAGVTSREMRGTAGRVGGGCIVWIGALALAFVVYTALGLAGIFLFTHVGFVGVAATVAVIVALIAVVARRTRNRSHDAEDA